MQIHRQDNSSTLSIEELELASSSVLERNFRYRFNPVPGLPLANSLDLGNAQNTMYVGGRMGHILLKSPFYISYVNSSGMVVTFKNTFVDITSITT